MSEMVERAAAAAYHAYTDTDPTAEWAWWPGKEDGVPYDWRKEADHTSVGSEGFLMCARAAISAMREPTEAMVEAGDNSGMLEWSLEPGEGLDGVNLDAAWRAMIDQALK